MVSTTKILLITTGLCLAFACQSSIERVRGALSAAPDWYTDKRDEIAGEGYPPLICRAREVETIASFQQELIFEEDLLDQRIDFLQKFSSLIEQESSDNGLGYARKMLSSLTDEKADSTIWTQDELDDLTALLKSLPDPS